MSTPSFAEARLKAEESLLAGEPREAFGHVRFQLGHDPAIAADRERWCEAFSLFARICEPIIGDPLASLVRSAVETPDDGQTLYDLGYQLIEAGLPDLACTALSRANLLYPNQEAIVTELVAALERDSRCHDAVRVLYEVPDLVESSFLCRYLLAYTSIMTGHLKEARQLLPELLLSTDPDELYMARRIEGMTKRAEIVHGVTPLDVTDLRGWHFVISGGLLLHLSPYGLEDAMRGRYCYTQDCPSRCLEGIRRLLAVLETWEDRPARVWQLADTDSAALALAAGQLLGCPVEAWPAGGSSEPGLICVYDLSTLDAETSETLRLHRPAQLLWVHAACWTEEPQFVGDLTTYLYQYNESAWGKRLRVDPETRKSDWLPPSTTSAEERAREILAAQTEEGALNDLATMCELALSIRPLKGDHAAGAFRRDGHRQRQGANSPVPSNRFT